jgi:predicted GIY-YIG superfamily endonuclease
LTICRIPPYKMTEPLYNEFRHLIETFCIFVDSWESDKLPANALRVFGRRKPVQEEETRILQNLEQSSNNEEFFYQLSEDVESIAEGQWHNASLATSAYLTTKVREPQKLYFYPNARYEITYNKTDQFSHSQLALMVEPPTREQINVFAPIKLLIAPCGCKQNPDVIDAAHLTENEGWRYENIGTADTTPTSISYGLKAKRKQYGLRMRIASTIHAIMGQTLDALVTRVTEGTGREKKDKKYALWLREQIVVLLSRTRRCQNMYFVGDPKATSKALADLLLIKTQYSEYICKLVDLLCVNKEGEQSSYQFSVIDQSVHSFRPIDIPLPSVGTGCVYLLLSLQDKVTTYIGQTHGLAKRLNEHNSGIGSKQTAVTHLRPWALIAYVVGFSNQSTKSLIAFEHQWQQLRDAKLQVNRSLTPTQTRNLATVVAGDYNDTISIVKCAQLDEINEN